MPRGDRTGPGGMGPMTGRGAGYCAGYDVPGYVNAAPGRVFPLRGGVLLRHGVHRPRSRRPRASRHRQNGCRSNWTRSSSASTSSIKSNACKKRGG
jgi:hypothetical protein